MLEVIDKGAATPTHPTPLLFVHGAFHGAWCWDDHFLDYFADRGYHALALNLRGHGASPSSVPINSCGVLDYVEDVKTVADRLPVPPVVIGHSMGGFVVQKYLAVHEAPAAVLVASAPPTGIAPATVRVAWRHRRQSVRTRSFSRPLDFFAAQGVSRATFYHSATPEEIVTACTSRLSAESARVLYRDLLYRRLARPKHVSAPVLVLGAELDGFFTPKEVAATARAYRTEPVMFPGMGHNMMLEHGWESVADRIDRWLTATVR
ncbi:alpha/beta hydrolase [Mycolicibacterium rhodesiae]|uniref:Alpha/beta hydrolase n=1 Tax=Mycolicibacterium rhodesiae TaxID=36814 RepID=A0A1X0J0M4_MYCRH|nr:alpha/beta fold hydrolase [Mycolicibacterium rhodesiae]MCV7345418.1 alpha/beta fold hydrolase [Mycolicibacterium rhodesiae]ORB55028.1 alpha/beta hydrolase [Mycolicibacterium rhodesiae]